MKNSIVIINKNEVGLKDTLSALKKFKNKDTEIIVVDGSNHKLDWIKKGHPEVIWKNFTLTIKNKATIPEQRNVGIRLAKGDTIIFIDSSCVPDDSQWLKNLTEPIVKEKEMLVRGTLSNIPNYITVNKKVGDKIYVTESPTINMAIARSVFENIGGFDETFSYGSDMDFSWRATHHGYFIRYVENAPVSHDFGSTKQNLKRYVNYGKARAKLYFNHPYYLSRIKNYELQCLIYFVIICLTPLVLFFPAYALVLIAWGIFIMRGDPKRELPERVGFAWGLILGVVSEVFHRSINKA